MQFKKGSNSTLNNILIMMKGRISHFCCIFYYNIFPPKTSCNNVAPVTNLCLGRATTRSHSSQ